jgi:hypothetical protein
MWRSDKTQAEDQIKCKIPGLVFPAECCMKDCLCLLHDKKFKPSMILRCSVPLSAQREDTKDLNGI